MIEMKNYSLKLGDFELKDVNVSIKDREIFAVIGVTGSGKSVLLEGLAGLHDTHLGDVYYDDVNIDLIDLSKREIGFVYQDYALFPHMTAAQNIEFGLKMHKVDRDEMESKTQAIMQDLSISHLSHRYPATLSGGEQQRVALARALVLAPKVIFMDEPFSALDPTTKEDMYALVKTIHAKYKCTIVFITHNFEEAQKLADRIAIMINGEIRAICDSQDLFESDDFDEEVKAFLGRRENG